MAEERRSRSTDILALVLLLLALVAGGLLWLVSDGPEPGPRAERSTPRRETAPPDGPDTAAVPSTRSRTRTPTTPTEAPSPRRGTRPSRAPRDASDAIWELKHTPQPRPKGASGGFARGGSVAGGSTSGPKVIGIGGGAGSNPTPLTPSAAWLAAHQAVDGSWGAQSFIYRCPTGPCDGAGTRDALISDTALSVTAAIAIGDPGLMPATLSGLKWLASQRVETDDGKSVWYGTAGDVLPHAQATLAFLEGYVLTGSRLYKSHAQRALVSLVAARLSTGGWPGNRAGGSYDADATLWACIAIRAAESVPSTNVEVPEDPYGTEPWRAPLAWDGSPYDAARGAFLHIALTGDVSTLSDLHARVAMILESQPRWTAGEADPVYWALASTVLRAAETEFSGAWHAALTRALDAATVDDAESSEHGSADPLGAFLGVEGRLRTTALIQIVRRVAAAPPGRPFDWWRRRR